MTRPVLILGAAATLPADLAALGNWSGPVMAVNRAGDFYPGRLDHWVSLHPEQLGGFMAERGGDLSMTTWCQREDPATRVDVVPQAVPCSGSSGLFAVRIALGILKARRVVLAGMPMDGSPHFYDAGRRSGPSFVPYRPEWRRAARDEFDGRVRSLSGWTADLLGRPDPAWLEG
ncbi:hypothetical protein EI613_27135 [Azospirillum sp. 412522]|nr:hypothetical protein [Azospirillum sp. 412522]MBY6265567.1 hypothetical protein [Azospirillum sp. 412522]